MNTQDPNPLLAAARRVDATDLQRAQTNGAMAAVEGEMNLHLWDIRLAAVLNTMDIARAHGEHRDWTSEHAAQIRAMLAIADKAVSGGDSAVIPQGFGPPMRTQIAETFIRAQAKVLGAVAAARASDSATGDGGAGGGAAAS